MLDTGRIKEPLLPEARHIVFGGQSEKEVQESVQLLATIDQAHIVMLAGCGLIERAAAREALSAIRQLEKESFAPLLGREQIRGLYMHYEAALTEMAPAVADMHLGRSRNDINATHFIIRCRKLVADLAYAVLRVRRSLLSSIERHGTTEMPVFSHRRPGMPGTWELYLSALEAVLARDFSALRVRRA